MKRLSEELPLIERGLKQQEHKDSSSKCQQHGSTANVGMTTTQSRGKELSTTLSPLGFSRRLTKDIKSDFVDWDGIAIFEGDKVVGFKSDCNSKNSYSLRPIPQDDESLQDAQVAKIRLDEFLRPANKHEFMELFKALTLHYYQAQRTHEEVVIMVRDYYTDIGSYPIVLLKEACANCRKDSSQKFMPKSGDILDKIKPAYRKLKHHEKRINQILGIEEVKEQSLMDVLKGI